MGFLKRIVAEAKKNVRKSPAIDYLYERGVSDDQIDAIEIGYFPKETWPPYVRQVDDEDIQQYIQWSSTGFRLKGKLVFPVRNPLGKILGFQIRSPDSNKKDYSKFYLQRAKVEAVFFGLEMAMEEIWETKEVFLCEGLFDYFPLQRVFPNTICTGTANVSTRQVEFLLRYVEDVNVVFDMDWGGNHFYDKFLEEHEDNFRSIQRIELRGKDVSEMWDAMGDEKLRERLTRTRI